MTVLDASLVTDALAGRGKTADAALARLSTIRVAHAPALLPAEVTSAVRGLHLGGDLREDIAAAALDRLRRMRIHLHDFAPFAERIWELRANLTVYDAWYLAVAEHLGVELVTTDAKLAAAPGVRCPVVVLAPWGMAGG